MEFLSWHHQTIRCFLNIARVRVINLTTRDTSGFDYLCNKSSISEKLINLILIFFCFPYVRRNYLSEILIAIPVTFCPSNTCPMFFLFPFRLEMRRGRRSSIFWCEKIIRTSDAKETSRAFSYYTCHVILITRKI